MEVIPAIDLLDNKVVRLFKGDFGQVTEYPEAPVMVAQSYNRAGISSLHVVDLNGARTGVPAHLEVITEITATVGLAVQVGGGIRRVDQARALISAGAERVVIGSTAARDPDAVIRWCGELGPDSIIIGVDVALAPGLDPIVQTAGWTQSSNQSLWSLMDYFMAAGVRHFLCTDISRDGTLTGPNLGLYRECNARYPAAQIIASGGISQASELPELAATGVASVVTGKALLDGRLTIAEIEQFLQSA
ncbi:MAG: 1-(5-phosphoribosyl)-5-[(5-phosphoribosylamino)methylideneamino] imidazole-4-carboxamide isomerase [Gammaproteobacteria bacterium]|nr:1-(5-phosphoribosyl)-5-[(5-phosphoribosylamino)methylideneamino] imidazole-4-carboxamide isomerase [Gammaproteobacteria bacterium]